MGSAAWASRRPFRQFPRKRTRCALPPFPTFCEREEHAEFAVEERVGPVFHRVDVRNQSDDRDAPTVRPVQPPVGTQQHVANDWVHCHGLLHGPANARLQCTRTNLCRRTTAFTCRAGRKERDVSKNRIAARSSATPLFGVCRAVQPPDTSARQS